MAFAKVRLQDVQELTLTISAQETKGYVDITHGLQDENDNDLTPDTVICELVDYPGFADDSDPPITQFVVVRSDPEDGTVRVYGVQNVGSEEEIDYTVRVTSIVWHSIQGDDHTA